MFFLITPLLILVLFYVSQQLTGNGITLLFCGRCPRSHASRVKAAKEQPLRRRSTKDSVSPDVEDGVITNQEALQVNNSTPSGTAVRQVEATLTSSNGVQTNILPASQPLLSRDNSIGDDTCGDKHDLQVTYSNASGEEDEKRQEGDVTTTNLDNLSLSNSSALALLQEADSTAMLPLPPEDNVSQKSGRNEPPTCGIAGNNNTPEKSPAVYSYMFRSLSARLSTLERHLANTERGIREVVEALSNKDVTLERKRLDKEWKFIAFALDRIFFLIFIVAIGVSLGTLFPRPYQLQFL